MVAGSDHASIPARILAERLRGLREREFRPLTQRVLAKALGGSEPLSIATISQWEKPDSNRLPPPQRLKVYARLFCSSRSFASATPRLLRDDELTDAERERELELYEELLELRDRAQSTDAAASSKQFAIEHQASLWRFPDDSAISIVCSDAPRPDRPSYADQGHLNYSRYARHADLDALIEVHGQVRADNPGSWLRILSPRSLEYDFALNHLVIIGGAAIDDAAPWFAQGVPLPTVHESEDTHIFTYEIEGKVREFKSARDDDGNLTHDVGFIARAPHRIVPGHTVIVLGGITSRGVHGAALAFSDPHVRDANWRYLTEAFGDADTFILLMRVPVRNEAALPPNLSDEDVRLYEWSAETGARW
ncbi:MAG TPA: helix-turn-helix transcriptional regulator [Streptosporangiaceae bacterium]